MRPNKTFEHLYDQRFRPFRHETVIFAKQAVTRTRELGTGYGDFAEMILKFSWPTALHIVDITLARFRRNVFASAIDQATVRSRESESVEALPRFSDGSFDWFYSDADHSYAGVKCDIDAVRGSAAGARGRVARTPAEPIGKGLLMHNGR